MAMFKTSLRVKTFVGVLKLLFNCPKIRLKGELLVPVSSLYYSSRDEELDQRINVTETKVISVRVSVQVNL